MLYGKNEIREERSNGAKRKKYVKRTLETWAWMFVSYVHDQDKKEEDIDGDSSAHFTHHSYCQSNMRSLQLYVVCYSMQYTIV